MLQKVGCDGFLGSLAREDHCGVCNGNGKSCKIIKGDFNHTRGAGNYSFNSFQKKNKSKQSLGKRLHGSWLRNHSSDSIIEDFFNG